MKILFILGFSNPFPGAGWTRIGFFAENWSKKGNLVEVLGAFGYKSFQKKGIRRYEKVNILNTIFNMNLTCPPVFILNSLVSFLVSTLLLLAKKPKIVVVSVPPGDVGLGALITCKLLGAKCVVDYRDEWEDCSISIAKSKAARNFYHIIRKFTSLLYAESKLMAVVTPGAMKALEERGLRNVELITNGADIKTFKPLGINKDSETFSIFYSGNVGGYYRLEVVVKAVRKLIDRGFNDIRLVIAGKGEIHDLLSLAEKIAMSGHIKYVGSVNEKEKLARLIAIADAGIIPYDDNPLWKNALPTKFYEYCACGIPVIATTHDDSLLAHIIRAHQIGITSPPLDEEKLAEAILWLYQNKSFRETAGKRTRRLIEEKFDRNKIATEFLNLVRGFT